MSISSFFSRLGAPLKNVRWSWGAVRESDGTVFLRVWQDRIFVDDDKKIPVIQITNHEKYDERPVPGWEERLKHIELVRKGAKCYLVMCRAKDPSASPREIAGWNAREVFVGGELREVTGDTWIEAVRRIPISETSHRENHVET